jgi:hypothetical protein
MQALANVRSLKKIAGVVLAVRYRRAAKRDEQNGFPLTAAFEWRRAAELSAPIILLERNCWRQWERIMHLPHRLADPIDLAPAAHMGTLQPKFLRACRLRFPSSQYKQSRRPVCEFPGINIQQLLENARL